MTGFGNPRFEGAAKKSSSASLNVTSPKAILGAISNAAGFSNPTRQQLERSLSQEKVQSPSHVPSPLFAVHVCVPLHSCAVVTTP